jgi:hypothetical protein
MYGSNASGIASIGNRPVVLSFPWDAAVRAATVPRTAVMLDWVVRNVNSPA